MSPLQVRNITFGEGLPKICVPIACPDIKELPGLIAEVRQAEPDAAELRADWLGGYFTECSPDGKRYLRKERVREVLGCVREALRDTVLLFTWRTAAEGGTSPEADPFYAEITEEAVSCGLIDMVDVEYKSPDRSCLAETAGNYGIPVIFSEHYFDKTPEEEYILSALEKMALDGADIAKIAVMPFSKEDAGILMRAAKRAASRIRIPIIAVAMGEYGKESRIRADLTGSCLTFGTAGNASAPGQIPAHELRKLLLAFHKEFV